MTQAADWAYFEKALAFLEEIGITVLFEQVTEGLAMPGICIRRGHIIIDKNKLAYPGDILHEAGHIAVVPLAERATLNNETIAQRPHAPAEEMMAIAWSYATCVYLDLPAEFVFHDHGYKGGGKALSENFTQGNYIGVPMLQYLGMCGRLEQPGIPPYPHMLTWTLP